MSNDSKSLPKDKIDSVDVISQDVESNSEDTLEPDVAELPKVVRKLSLLRMIQPYQS